MKRNFLFIVVAVVLSMGIVGCNMMRGAGKDISNAGGSIQKTVDHND